MLHRKCTVSCAFVSVLLFSGVGFAQVSQLDVEATLACFREVRAAGGIATGCPNGAVPAEAIMLQPSQYPNQVVRAVSDGLKRMAIESPNVVVQTDALSFLAASGSTTGGPGPRATGVVRRLADVYDTGTHEAFVVTSMRDQEDRGSAVEFVATVASDGRAQSGPWPPQAQAVAELEHMGSAGEVALRKLHQTGAISHPVARARMQRIAERKGWD